ASAPRQSPRQAVTANRIRVVRTPAPGVFHLLLGTGLPIGTRATGLARLASVVDIWSRDEVGTPAQRSSSSRRLKVRARIRRSSVMSKSSDQIGSVRSGLRLMSRGHERLVGGIVVTAVLSGIAEAGILAVIAQVAAALVSGADGTHLTVGS